MGSAKATASYQVIDLVRERISTPYVRASDAAVARALGITPGAVGGYKSGRDVMGLATLAKAQEFMELSAPQLADLSVALSMEGAKDPGVQKVWQAIRDTVRGAAASVLLGTVAMVAHSPDAFARENTALSRTPAPSANFPIMYIMSRRRRLAEALRRFARHFPVPPLLPAQLSAA